MNWPKAHEISNGQRDILTFIALLLKSKRNFRKKDCILIIDEIFDYMDDANLITFQYYISTFIDEMKRDKKRIFPILLTHLDPLFFNHFCFNNSKIKVSYIKDINIKSNQEILKLIYKRAEESIQDKVDAGGERGGFFAVVHARARAARDPATGAGCCRAGGSRAQIERNPNKNLK